MSAQSEPCSAREPISRAAPEALPYGPVSGDAPRTEPDPLEILAEQEVFSHE